MTDFTAAEYQARVAKAQRIMSETGVDALLFCTEPEMQYFTGFRTLFWQSPTRPWFLVIPGSGEPVAVIPEIGAALMAKTWISDIRTWSSPDPKGQGISLLAAALEGAGRVGMPMGPESALRMPLVDFQTLQRLSKAEFVDATPLIRDLRAIKSAAEVNAIGRIAGIASAAFARVPEIVFCGQPLDQVFVEFKIALLKAGAGDVPYLVGGAGPGGYGDVISPPDARPLQDGDVLMMDTGSTKQGYFCDFDRNFAVGRADDAAQSAYVRLWNATESALLAARPGVTCAELYRIMAKSLDGGSAIGRFGHGLGLQLTEGLSIAAFDTTVLRAGMVITLEPSVEIGDGKMMVHEENIAITDGAPLLLSERAAPELPVI